MGGNVARATSELLLTFMAANSKFYGGTLPVPEVTIQTSGRAAAYGWMTLNKVWSNNNGGSVEINICAEYLNRPLIAIIGTLLHEMAHLENLTQGIKDVSGHQYHNKHFRAAAEKIGLEVTNTPQYGYSKTEPNEQLTKWIYSLNLNEQVFQTFRGNLDSTDTGKGTPPKKGDGSKTKMLKWSCGCTNIRCAVILKATCEKCGNKFHKA